MQVGGGAAVPGGAIGITYEPNLTWKASHIDHRVWQDVYRPLTAVGYVYLKVSVINDVLIVPFKEL